MIYPTRLSKTPMSELEGQKFHSTKEFYGTSNDDIVPVLSKVIVIDGRPNLFDNSGKVYLFDLDEDIFRDAISKLWLQLIQI